MTFGSLSVSGRPLSKLATHGGLINVLDGSFRVVYCTSSNALGCLHRCAHRQGLQCAAEQWVLLFEQYWLLCRVAGCTLDSLANEAFALLLFRMECGAGTTYTYTRRCGNVFYTRALFEIRVYRREFRIPPTLPYCLLGCRGRLEGQEVNPAM